MVLQILTKFRNFRFNFDGKKISEIQVLYFAKFLRFLAINLSSGIAMIYFYKLYGWNGVIFALISLWLAKGFTTFLGGIYIAKNGPKHGILLSNILAIPMLVVAGLAGQFGAFAMIVAMIFQGLSYQLYNISYYVDFSKIKNGEKSARQLGNMQIIEKITSLVAPVAGGFFAVAFGAQSTLLISAIFFAFSAVPLLATREVMKNNIKLNFRDFPFKQHRRNFFAQFMVGSLPVYVYLWGVFVPIFLFSSDNAYGISGILTSISSISSIVVSLFFGKSAGKKLLRSSVVLRSIMMIASSLSFTKISAIIINSISEISSVGYKISSSKGAFFDADKSGERIEYFMMFEGAYVFGGLIFTVIAGIFIALLGAEFGIRAFMIFASICYLGGLLFNFPFSDEKQK